MWWFALIFLCALVVSSSGNIVQVENDKNEEIASYVKALIEYFDKKDPSTKDVALIDMRDGRSQQVSDMIGAIRKSIPESVAVYSPPILKIVKGQNLRKASFVIIVVDVFYVVSFLSSNF